MYRTKAIYRTYGELEEYFHANRFKKGFRPWVRIEGAPGEPVTFFDESTYHGVQESFDALFDPEGHIVVNEDFSWNADFEPLDDEEIAKFEEEGL